MILLAAGEPAHARLGREVTLSASERPEPVVDRLQPTRPGPIDARLDPRYAPTVDVGALAECTVQPIDGEVGRADDGAPPPPRRLGDLWRERPAVIAFVRHFG